MRCPTCQSPLATIEVCSEPAPLAMGSCDRCSRRHWFRGTTLIDVHQALALVPASTNRRAVGARRRTTATATATAAA